LTDYPLTLAWVFSPHFLGSFTSKVISYCCPLPLHLLSYLPGVAHTPSTDCSFLQLLKTQAELWTLGGVRPIEVSTVPTEAHPLPMCAFPGNRKLASQSGLVEGAVALTTSAHSRRAVSTLPHRLYGQGLTGYK
jgi:hypothetical protein